MKTIVKLDKRGRLVIPSRLRNKMRTSYLEIREKEGKLILIPIQDPLHALLGKVSRAKPLKPISKVAEEEAERILREERRKTHADPRS